MKMNRFNAPSSDLNCSKTRGEQVKHTIHETKLGLDCIFGESDNTCTASPSLSPSPIPQPQGGRWGTIDDFTTSLLHFFLLDCLLVPGKLQVCPFPDVVFPPHFAVCLVFFPLSLCVAGWFWPDLMNERHVHTTAVCVSLRWPGSLRVVRLHTGSWHRIHLW